MNLDRLAILSEAIIDVAKGEDLKTSLKRLVQNAVNITECTYGALGSISPLGQLVDFTYVGMSDETADEIPTFPLGKGLLGYLLEHPSPLRVKEIQGHHASIGFPINHPVMHGFLGVPIIIRGELYGSLYLTNKRDGSDFSEEDEKLVSVFASAAGVALDNYRGQVAQNQVVILAERERIARDLHDLVIQSLFATGMKLNSLPRNIQIDEKAQELISESIESLDSTVNQIRKTIFDLHSTLQITNITTLIHSEIAAMSKFAGFKIHCEFNGPLDSVITPELGDQIVAVSRELLTNAIKHANSTKIELSLSTNKIFCTLIVRDNGGGYVPSSRRSGLLNVEKRARDRGGEFELLGNPQIGTIATWTAEL